LNRRTIKLAVSLAGCGIIAVVLILAIDALVAVNRMNPLPAAEAAALGAGWEVNLLRLRSVDASGGPLGSSALVKYRLSDTEDAEQLEVQLHRPILSPHWKVVSVATK
jgi:hypothetical protein